MTFTPCGRDYLTIIQQIASELDCNPASVRIDDKRLMEWATGERTSFLNGMATDKATGNELYFKLINRSPKLFLQFERGQAGLNLAYHLGIPTPKVHTVVYGREICIIASEAINCPQGHLLNSYDAIHDADPDVIAPKIVRALLDMQSKLIAEMVCMAIASQRRDFKCSETADPRNKSTNSLRTCFDDSVCQLARLPNLHLFCSQQVLQQSVASTCDSIERLEDTYGFLQANTIAIVHNKLNPGNLLLTNDGYAIACWECVGLTNSLVLSMLTDWPSYIGRLWPNPALQIAVVTGLAEHPPTDWIRADWIEFLRTVVAIYSVTIDLDVTVAENERVVAPILLGNLEPTLKAIGR